MMNKESDVQRNSLRFEFALSLFLILDNDRVCVLENYLGGQVRNGSSFESIGRFLPSFFQLFTTA